MDPPYPDPITKYDDNDTAYAYVMLAAFGRDEPKEDVFLTPALI